MRPDVARTVGVGGVGRMGGAAVQALLERGADVVVYDPDAEARARAEAGGARSVRVMSDLWSAAPSILLSLPSDDALGTVVASLPARLPQGATVLDLSTVGVQASLAAAESMASAGANYIDSPVIGGASNAGAWTLLVGARELPDAATEVLSVLGRVELTGRRGDGLRLKLLNNMLLAVHAAAVCDAVALARAVGLDPGTMHRVLLSANSVALSRLFAEVLPRALAATAGDRPANAFTTELLLKDARLALELANAGGVRLPTAHASFTQLVELGIGLEAEDFTRLFSLVAVR